MASTTAQTALSTPTKAPFKPSATPITESPGTWRHPHHREITKRKEASILTEKNIRRIIINFLLLVILIFLQSYVKKLLPPKRLDPQVWTYFKYTYYTLLAVPFFNICLNFWPLFRAKDEVSDIPLTPGQRRLLGLPQSSAPPTPGSVEQTQLLELAHSGAQSFESGKSYASRKRVRFHVARSPFTSEGHVWRTSFLPGVNRVTKPHRGWYIDGSSEIRQWP
ncbi:hypothetical protein E0Z10_g9388 [Xylaria hypoxylon]|uniref:Uncharacterized protein n=1 Tax=Xylaria hypoxylon TaxID=37992 RepID=A0A4Z0Y5Q4_9PEZI|nr:hypothetical protein E0Z10_g9388 [Xylaria hypoxylon]